MLFNLTLAQAFNVTLFNLMKCESFVFITKETTKENTLKLNI